MNLPVSWKRTYPSAASMRDHEAMLFNSPQFLFIFLPLTLFATLSSLRLFGRTSGVAVLVAASLTFYASWHFWAVGLAAVDRRQSGRLPTPCSD